MSAPGRNQEANPAGLSWRLVAVLVTVLLVLPGLSMVSAQSNASQKGAKPQVTGQEVKDAFLRGQNLSSVGTLHSPVIPIPQFSRSNKTDTGDPPIYNQAYTGAYGFQSSDTYQDLYSAITFVNFDGAVSSLDGATMSAGLGVHVPNTTYDLDYLFIMYAYVTPSGEENVAYAAYSACAGAGYNCGPAYSCPLNVCPVAYETIANGTITDVGNLNDQVGLTIHWDSNIASTGVGGYVFDYQDKNTLGNDWWTAVDVCPNSPGEWFCPANKQDLDMTTDALQLGVVTCNNNGVCQNAPVYAAYFFQVGFMIQSSFPSNSNWKFYANDTQYTIASNGGAGQSYFLNHATVVPWGSCQCNERYNEWSYWKEIWLVSGNSAANDGISTYGSGSSSTNYMYTMYTGGSQNSYQLW